MNSSGKWIVIAAFGYLISQVCTCTSSNLVDIWHDPYFQAPPLGKLFVIAVRKDATKRRIWEDAFTGELVKHGVAATPSYRLFPVAPPDTNQVIATVQANGFDGILAILILPTETNVQHVPGYTTSERKNGYIHRGRDDESIHRDRDDGDPAIERDDRHRILERDDRAAPYYGHYWKRYITYYHEIDHPGYIDSQTVDVRAIDVTTTGTGGRLIWSATSRTPDPGTVTDVQRGIVSLVLSELERRHIINYGK